MKIMKLLIAHYLMNYHYRMAMKYDKKFKHHCFKHNVLYEKKQWL